MSLLLTVASCRRVLSVSRPCPRCPEATQPFTRSNDASQDASLPQDDISPSGEQAFKYASIDLSWFDFFLLWIASIKPYGVKPMHIIAQPTARLVNNILCSSMVCWLFLTGVLCRDDISSCGEQEHELDATRVVGDIPSILTSCLPSFDQNHLEILTLWCTRTFSYCFRDQF